MIKISFITITAQQNHPYSNRPDLDVFEPTIEAFKTQTMDKNDFEWIIVDYLYDQRKDYFKDKKLPFKVKHIPSSPNIWHDAGLPGVCTQYNKGIIYADGELLYFGGEGYIFVPEFCERLWAHYKEGYSLLVWYLIDDTFIPAQFLMQRVDDVSKKLTVKYNGIMDISYDISGYTGKEIFIEHRPITAFKGNDIEVYNAPWEWWFGCSSAPLEAMLKINGFDQRFDGDKMLLDCDVGSRLQLAGLGKFGLFRDLFMIRLRNEAFTWNTILKKETPSIKCNLGLIWISRFLGESRANTRKITDEDINWIKEVFCANNCQNGEHCRTLHPWQYQFEHKEGYPGHFSEKRLYEFWRNNQVLINLTDERNKRIAGDEKYKGGTYI